MKHSDLSDLTVEEMLYLKEELNQAYQRIIDQHNEWLKMCHALRDEMKFRSEYLKYAEEEAKLDREADYSHMYEVLNNVH